MRQSNEYFYQIMEECVEALDNCSHAAFEHSFMDDEKLKNRIANKISGVKGHLVLQKVLTLQK